MNKQAVRELFLHNPYFKQRVASYHEFKKVLKKVEATLGKDHPTIEWGYQKLAYMKAEIVKETLKQVAP